MRIFKKLEHRVDPLYQVDIEGIHKSLSKNQKKIPLFFALNVFDTLSPSERKKSFLQIAELQNDGDRLLIMLDTNPCLQDSVEHLQSLYPNHALFPYYPLTNTPAKVSLIIIPLDCAPFQPSSNEILGMINEESISLRDGGFSSLQLKLNKLH